jgi:hypothetical protein
MKVSGWFAAAVSAVAVLVACSSSSSGGGSSVPTCQGATGTMGAGSSACSSCLQSSCGSQISSVESSCGAYLTCYQGCQCSDLSCLEGCLSKIDSTCQNPEESLATCLTQSCSSQCTTTTVSDGGTG